jgi:hypothetical protein
MKMKQDPHDGETAPHFGWRSPFEQLERLRESVGYLRETKSPKPSLCKRFENATFFLNIYLENAWPQHLRRRIGNLQRACSAVQSQFAHGIVFRFDLLPPKQRRAFADDIFALYEACLLDIGRMRAAGELGEYDYQLAYPTEGESWKPQPRADKFLLRG